MKKVIPFLIILFFVFSCKEELQNPSEKTTEKVKDATFLVTSRFEFLTLKSTVDKQLREVSEFKYIKGQIDTLNTKTNFGIENNLEELSEELNNLGKALPKQLNNNGVLSRINQLNTYVLLLDDSLKNSSKADSLLVEKQTSSLLKAYNSLLVQFNETENSISEDFKNELEKAKFKRDSLNQSEVAPLF